MRRVIRRSFSSSSEILHEWAGLKHHNMSHSMDTVTLTKHANGVVDLKLNRPQKFNAMNMQMFLDIETAFHQINQDATVKCVILSAEGNHFSAGIDLEALMGLRALTSDVECPARQRECMANVISRLQRIISLPEKCHAPTIAAVHGLCIGAGVDLVSACDLRVCVDTATFCVKEIDLAIVADLGTLQRLPNIVGQQRAREMAFTGRDVKGPEALQVGLVLESFLDVQAMSTYASKLAGTISKKSSITMRGIKESMNFSMDHTVDEGLQNVLRWNAAHLLSDDLEKLISRIQK